MDTSARTRRRQEAVPQGIPDFSATPELFAPELFRGPRGAAKSPSEPDQSVVEKVRICDPAAAEKACFRGRQELTRTTFQTNREMDFFSESELVKQTGHGRREWPLVIVKECIDNALDACEEAGVEPVVEVIADACGITIRDNGPGIPESTVDAVLDFTVRASSREAYVAPDRGAQGNALKTLAAMGYVLDSAAGLLIITARGKRHRIRCAADPITQRPIVHHEVESVESSGTEVRIEWAAKDENEWPSSSWYGHYHYAHQIQLMIEGFSIFNPHATLSLDWFGTESTWRATDARWLKWKACHPTSIHWYEPSHFERLLCAYIAHDRIAGQDRLVSDLLAEFDGLSGSAKRKLVLDQAGLKRARLSELVANDQLDSRKVRKLLAAMRRQTKPVKSSRLGIIGEEHFRQRFVAIGIDPASFHYNRRIAKTGLPYVIECAFGYLGESCDERRIYSGVNWSAAIKNPFRNFGDSSEGLETELEKARIGEEEPIVFAIHLAHPRVEYTDRGKSTIVIGADE